MHIQLHHINLNSFLCPPLLRVALSTTAEGSCEEHPVTISFSKKLLHMLNISTTYEFPSFTGGKLKLGDVKSQIRAVEQFKKLFAQ